MTTLNQIKIVNNSGLHPSKYTVWVAGFMADATDGSKFQILQQETNPPQGIATMEGGVVLGVQVTSPGSGYIAPPVVTIEPPGNGGMTATAVATIENGAVTGVTMTNSGSGYDFSPQVSFSADGSFAAAATATNAFFVNVNSGLTIQVPNVTNSGNNRLVFTVTPSGTMPTAYPLNGYTAYPFPGEPGVAPAGPYDIFEFGPNAEYDVSAVDSFGINLSFTVAGDTLTYGAMPSVTRKQIGDAFKAFMKADHHGTAFSQLRFTSPVGTGYPQLIEGQFSAIVSPKDWLAIYPSATGLKGYWQETVDAFFASGNQISFYLHGATAGTYSGSSDDTQYTLSGPNGMTVVIPKSDFAGNQPFFQAVRGPNQETKPQGIATMEGGVVLGVQVTSPGSGYIAPPVVTIEPPGNGGMTATAVATIENGAVTGVTMTNGGSGYDFSPQVSFSGESPLVYAAFGQIETAIFGAFSRGVVLDGVVPAGQTISATYSSDAWSNIANWYSNHNNAYNNQPSVYDAYAKFFHTSTVNGTVGSPTIFGMNSSNKFAMAYGFSLDENPNVGSTNQNIPPSTWPSSQNVPAKTNYNVGSQTVTLTVGTWS